MAEKDDDADEEEVIEADEDIAAPPSAGFSEEGPREGMGSSSGEEPTTAPLAPLAEAMTSGAADGEETRRKEAVRSREEGAMRGGIGARGTAEDGDAEEGSMPRLASPLGRGMTELSPGMLKEEPKPPSNCRSCTGTASRNGRNQMEKKSANRKKKGAHQRGMSIRQKSSVQHEETRVTSYFFLEFDFEHSNIFRISFGRCFQLGSQS